MIACLLLGGLHARQEIHGGLAIAQNSGTLSSEEIDKRLRALGLTREEAQRKAAERGIDLEQLLAAQQTAPRQPEVQATLPPSPSADSPEMILGSDQPLLLGPDGIPYFGYEIFRFSPEAFEPAVAGPVDPEYLVEPGDVLRVTVWGQVEFESEHTVDPQGKIFISTVGQVLVSGMTLERLYDKLLKQMSRSYSGLIGQRPTVWLDVTLARLRPKRVFMMGEVTAPGSYTVSSYATVFNALFSVGGPSIQGSLRDVRLIRGGKVVARVDLYKYLMGADQTDDVRVQNNDIIFAPIRGKTVSIRGAVRRPAIYELLENERLGALLQFAGGVLPNAYGTTAQVERIRPLSERTGGVEDRFVQDVDLKGVVDGSSDIELHDADRIQVFGVLDVLRNYATVSGSVWRPGRYELGKIETVRELVNAAEGVQPRAYLDLAHLIRFNEDQITTRIVPLDLGLLLKVPSQDQRLQPRDEVIVYSKEILETTNKYVSVRGEVKNPGRYPFRDSLMLEDLIPLAGGYTEEADVHLAEVSRVVPAGLGGDSLALLLHPILPTTFSSRLEEATDRNPQPFLLQHRDEILVRTNPGYKHQKNVTITGEVVSPGIYSLQRRGERLSELLDRASGPTSSAYLGGARFFRHGARVLLDFEEAFYFHGEVHDITMEVGDSIHVPSKPNTVLVLGEVQKSGLLSYIEGDDLQDYLNRAGGTTDSAYYALLTKPTGESQKVGLGVFSGNPEVPDGSVIEVAKEPVPPQPEKAEAISTTVKDIFALLTSAATLIFIVHQTTK